MKYWSFWSRLEVLIGPATALVLTRVLILGLAALTALAATGCGGDDDTTPTDTGLSTSLETLDFGDVPLETSTTLSFDLVNGGSTAVELQSVTLIEGLQSIFNVQWAHESSLEPGASTTVTVTFAPAKVQAYSGRIQIRSTDETNPALYVTLSGTGSASTKDKDGDGFSPAEGDCNDADASLYPGAPEACDGKDNNCDGVIPSNEADADGDGYRICQSGSTPGDCDDTNKLTYPGAKEICDSADNNCDGVNSDNTDRDGDGYTVCTGDCNDNPSAGGAKSAPGKDEVCDSVDNDCDGGIDNLDFDHDGYSQCDPAGDCDDDDASAHPTYVNAAYTGGGSTGTAAAPYTTLEGGLSGLDAACRTVYLYGGASGSTYSVTTQLSDGRPLAIRGESAAKVTLEPSDTDRLFNLSNGSSLELENVTVTGGAGAGDGGAILAQNGDVTLTGVVATGNEGSADGGFIAVESGTLTLDSCTFTGNTALDDGGAVVVVSGVFIDRNSDYTGNQGVRGGGLSLQASQATMAGLTFDSNIATDSGGGLSAYAMTGFQLEQSRFWSNVATNYGGGLALDDVTDNDGYLRSCLVQNNDGGKLGGGISLAGTQGLMVSNNTLTENRSTSNGAGIVLRSSSSRQTNLTLLANIVAWSNGPSGLYEESSGSSISDNTVFNTSTTVNYAGQIAGGSDGNDEVNPQFTTFAVGGAPSADNLTLKSTSPCVNTGPSDEAYNDPDGSRNDRGAYGGPQALSAP